MNDLPLCLFRSLISTTVFIFQYRDFAQFLLNLFIPKYFMF